MQISPGQKCVKDLCERVEPYIPRPGNRGLQQLDNQPPPGKHALNL